MATPVNLHGRALDRCTIFGSVPQRNARIMNPKNPDLGCVSLGKSKPGFLYPKTDFAFLYLNPKMD